MNLKEAIQILDKKVTNIYAKEYLKNIPTAIDEGGTNGLCIQLKYILENSKAWRSDEARKVKAFINEWITLNYKK
jgi:hypothetical protein